MVLASPLGTLTLAFLAATALAQPPKRLWVLHPPAEIIEYDTATFAARRTLKVASRVIEHPEYLNINAGGQMLFLPLKDAQWASGEMATAGGRAWFWDGRQATEWQIEGPTTRGSDVGTPTVTETTRQWLLSAGGESLYRFENRFEKVTQEPGPKLSVRATARMWRTGVDGARPETIASLSSPEWCECTTGVCSESCPEWSAWAPDGIVRDCFLVTRFTPGQIGSAYHESLLYERSGRAWQIKKLPRPIETPLTASARGEVLLAAVPDGGCCGWENDSSDQVLLVEHGKVSVLFDEFERYNNRDYDVSFYVRDARLGPGNAMLAYTIASTESTDGAIRLSLDGKPNAEELARVRKVIAGLPAVEVLKLGVGLRPAMALPHAELVGWLSGHEVLVAEGGRLVVYDLRAGHGRPTSIQVRTAADAFLR